MQGSDLILYLDFDGVLHHENVRISNRRGPFLLAHERYKLFQHSDLLAEVLQPYPAVSIVLSTNWALRYGVLRATQRLPASLQERVIGGTFHTRHMNKQEFNWMTRGQQVLADVARRMPRDWLALDDDAEGWGPHASHHIRTHEHEGLSDPEVLAVFTQKLEAMCKTT